MISAIDNDAKSRMLKAIEALKNYLKRLRTGRAHPSLVEHIKVDYYGSSMPISQVANVAVSDSRTLTITPWEKPMVQAIEKAIMNSDLNLNPNTTGTVIRIILPPLTEERRKDLVKVVKAEGENARVAIRNIRRDANNAIKDLLKKKEISEDDERRAEETIQKLTDGHIKEVDQILAEKEKELMEV